MDKGGLIRKSVYLSIRLSVNPPISFLSKWTKQRIETAIQIRLEILRLLTPPDECVASSERIAELTEVQSHEAERALTVESREKKTFPAPRSARAHENALTPSSLMQSEEWASVELLTERATRSIDRRSKRTRSFHFGRALETKLAQNSAICPKHDSALHARILNETSKRLIEPRRAHRTTYHICSAALSIASRSFPRLMFLPVTATRTMSPLAVAQT